MTENAKYRACIGSISTGTMRTEDLIKTFSNELRRLQDEGFGTHSDLLARCDQYLRISEPTDAEQEMGADLLDYLFDALDEYAPEGCYFGAHEGDGADYGFWSVDQDDDRHFS